MPGLLRRRAAVIATAAISLTAVPAVAAAAAPAATTSHSFICNSAGQHKYCIGASSLAAGSQVRLSGSPRYISVIDQRWKYLNKYEVYRLRFDGDTSKCVGQSNSSENALVRDCNGGTKVGVNWVKLPVSGHVEFGSVPGNSLADGWPSLASDNRLGAPLFIVGDSQSIRCSGGGCYFGWNIRT